MANRSFTRSFYTFHEYPVLVDCNFIVDQANGNGFGVRSLKGEGVVGLFMNTSSTPGTIKAGILNPNPAAGYILLYLQDNYNRYFSGFVGFANPLSGSSVTTTVISVPNTIVSLGSTTLAQWQALGLPQGVTPAVGVAFIANASSAIPGGGAIQIPAAAGSGIDHIEVIGDPNTTIHPFRAGGKNYGYIVLACYKNGVLTQPAAGTTISLASYLSNSSNTVKGE